MAAARPKPRIETPPAFVVVCLDDRQWQRQTGLVRWLTRDLAESMLHAHARTCNSFHHVVDVTWYKEEEL